MELELKFIKFDERYKRRLQQVFRELELFFNNKITVVLTSSPDVIEMLIPSNNYLMSPIAARKVVDRLRVIVRKRESYGFTMPLSRDLVVLFLKLSKGFDESVVYHELGHLLNLSITGIVVRAIYRGIDMRLIGFLEFAVKSIIDDMLADTLAYKYIPKYRRILLEEIKELKETQKKFGKGEKGSLRRLAYVMDTLKIKYLENITRADFYKSPSYTTGRKLITDFIKDINSLFKKNMIPIKIQRILEKETLGLRLVEPEIIIDQETLGELRKQMYHKVT